MWKSLFIAGASIWSLSAQAATLSMQRGDAGMQVRTDDGVLTVKGHVQKPVLKERFKQFNAAMDEIHRTQGAWVVSDEQLQSELRVSIAAVVVPAYRSFLGRFAQHFSAGR